MEELQTNVMVRALIIQRFIILTTKAIRQGAMAVRHGMENATIAYLTIT